MSTKDKEALSPKPLDENQSIEESDMEIAEKILDLVDQVASSDNPKSGKREEMFVKLCASLIKKS